MFGASQILASKSPKVEKDWQTGPFPTQSLSTQSTRPWTAMLCIGSLGPPSWSQPWTFSNKSWECQQLRHAETKGFEPNVWAILPLMGAVFFVLRSTKIGFTLSSDWCGGLAKILHKLPQMSIPHISEARAEARGEQCCLRPCRRLIPFSSQLDHQLISWPPVDHQLSPDDSCSLHGNHVKSWSPVERKLA